MESLLKAILKMHDDMPGLDLREFESMKEHCSFKLGGEVRAYIAPKDVWEMSKVFFYLHNHDVAPLMVGKCTNLIIPEEGLDICVVSTENLQDLRMGETENTVYAEAGVSLARLAQFAQEKGLAGLEFASGIPGSENGGEMRVEGGTLLAIGSSGMAETFGETSTQCSFIETLSKTYPADTKVIVRALDGTVLVEHTSATSFDSVVFTDPALKVGESCELTVGDDTLTVSIDAITNGEGSGFGMPSFGGFGRR